MAFHPYALLLSMPGFNSLACGGVVLLPKDDDTAQRGKRLTSSCDLLFLIVLIIHLSSHICFSSMQKAMESFGSYYL